MRRALALAACLLATLAFAPAVANEAPGEDRVATRAFEIKFRSVADASELVSPLLSAEGTVTLQPRLRVLTVRDRGSILEQVASVLEAFDVPPRNVEVTVGLFLGTDRRDQEAGRRTAAPVPSREVRGVSETLGDFTKWNEYAPLGSRAITGAEGSRVEVPISDEYRVSYEIDAVKESASGSHLRLRGFTLERRVERPGAEPEWRLVYRADVLLPAGRMLVVGAAQNPESKRALFVTLKARPR